jgi:hypothetical protein
LIDSLKKPEGFGVGTPAVATAGVETPAPASGAGTDEHDHIIDEG